MKKGALKGIVCLVVIVVIWMAVSFRSKPLSEEGEISLENFVVCRVQTMEIKNDTGYGRAAELRDAAQVQKALNALGEIEVRKMMPWEKLLSDRQEQETYYTMMIGTTAKRKDGMSRSPAGREDALISEIPPTWLRERRKQKQQTYWKDFCRNTKQQNKKN